MTKGRIDFYLFVYFRVWVFRGCSQREKKWGEKKEKEKEKEKKKNTAAPEYLPASSTLLYFSLVVLLQKRLFPVHRPLVHDV